METCHEPYVPGETLISESQDRGSLAGVDPSLTTCHSCDRNVHFIEGDSRIAHRKGRRRVVACQPSTSGGGWHENESNQHTYIWS